VSEISVASDQWARVALGEIAEVVRGVTYDKEHARSEPGRGLVPVLRATNIGFELSFDELVYVPEHYIRPDQYLRVGDIVVATSSGSLSVVGKGALVRSDVSAAFGAFCSVLRPTSAIEPRFLAYFLRTSEYRETVSALAAGVNINNLRRGHLENLTIRVPPLAQQRRIVAALEEKLSDLDAAVSALERARANVTRFRAAVMRATVNGSLGRYQTASVARIPGPDPWSPAVPSEWRWAALGDLADVVEYGTSAKTSEDDGGVPVLRMGNIVDGELSTEELKFLPASHHEFPRLFLLPGDLLFNRTNSPELVGKCAVYRGHPATASFASYLLRVRLKPEVLPDLVSVFINSSYGRSWVKNVVSQQVGQANVNGTKLRALRVPVPPAQKQQALVTEIERQMLGARRLATEIETQLARAARLRQAILKRAFDAQLVPQDPNDEPASVLLGRVRAERDGASVSTRAPRGRKNPSIRRA
jgi:type I restriction enzyme, S subunit